MFHYVVVMGYGDRPRRQVKALAELVYRHEEGRVEARVLWDRERDGLDIDLNSILEKSVRVKELLPRVERPLEEVAGPRALKGS